jgi:hypothetical protein
MPLETLTSSQGEHGVVNIASPVKIAFAPAKKHIAYANPE